MSHANRSQGNHLVLEMYDDHHVRVIASGATPEAAERQLDRETKRRVDGGYGFFTPLLRIVGDRNEVHRKLFRAAALLPRWE